MCVCVSHIITGKKKSFFVFCKHQVIVLSIFYIYFPLEIFYEILCEWYLVIKPSFVTSNTKSIYY